MLTSTLTLLLLTMIPVAPAQGQELQRVRALKAVVTETAATDSSYGVANACLESDFKSPGFRTHTPDVKAALGLGFSTDTLKALLERSAACDEKTCTTEDRLALYEAFIEALAPALDSNLGLDYSAQLDIEMPAGFFAAHASRDVENRAFVTGDNALNYIYKKLNAAINKEAGETAGWGPSGVVAADHNGVIDYKELLEPVDPTGSRMIEYKGKRYFVVLDSVGAELRENSAFIDGRLEKGEFPGGRAHLYEVTQDEDGAWSYTYLLAYDVGYKPYGIEFDATTGTVYVAGSGGFFGSQVVGGSIAEFNIESDVATHYSTVDPEFYASKGWVHGLTKSMASYGDYIYLTPLTLPNLTVKTSLDAESCVGGTAGFAFRGFCTGPIEFKLSQDESGQHFITSGEGADQHTAPIESLESSPYFPTATTVLGYESGSMLMHIAPDLYQAIWVISHTENMQTVVKMPFTAGSAENSYRIHEMKAYFKGPVNAVAELRMKEHGGIDFIARTLNGNLITIYNKLTHQLSYQMLEHELAWIESETPFVFNLSDTVSVQFGIGGGWSGVEYGKVGDKEGLFFHKLRSMDAAFAAADSIGPDGAVTVSGEIGFASKEYQERVKAALKIDEVNAFIKELDLIENPGVSVSTEEMSSGMGALITTLLALHAGPQEMIYMHQAGEPSDMFARFGLDFIGFLNHVRPPAHHFIEIDGWKSPVTELQQLEFFGARESELREYESANTLEATEKQAIELEAAEKQALELETAEREAIQLEGIKKEAIILEAQERDTIEAQPVEAQKAYLIESEKVEAQPVEATKVLIQESTTVEAQPLETKETINLQMETTKAVELKASETLNAEMKTTEATELKANETLNAEMKTTDTVTNELKTVQEPVRVLEETQPKIEIEDSTKVYLKAAPTTEYQFELKKNIEADQCSDDPNKMEPGICGCGVPDVDANRNGVMDCIESSRSRSSLDELWNLFRIREAMAQSEGDLRLQASGTTDGTSDARIAVSTESSLDYRAILIPFLKALVSVQYPSEVSCTNLDRPEKTPEIPEDEPKDVPEDEPKDVPEDIPEDIPEDEPKDIPEDEPTDIPEDEPKDIPEDEPKDIPEDEPEPETSTVPEKTPIPGTLTRKMPTPPDSTVPKQPAPREPGVTLIPVDTPKEPPKIDDTVPAAPGNVEEIPSVRTLRMPVTLIILRGPGWCHIADAGTGWFVRVDYDNYPDVYNDCLELDLSEDCSSGECGKVSEAVADFLWGQDGPFEESNLKALQDRFSQFVGGKSLDSQFSSLLSGTLDGSEPAAEEVSETKYRKKLNVDWVKKLEKGFCKEEGCDKRLRKARVTSQMSTEASQAAVVQYGDVTAFAAQATVSGGRGGCTLVRR